MNLKNIADIYFNAWKAHDFDALSSIMSNDISFIGVFGNAEGIPACIDGLRGLAGIMTDIVIQRRWIDESDIITWYDLYTTKTKDPIPVVNWSHVEKGLITKIRVTFDPRPLLM